MKARFRDWSSLPAELIESISDRLPADADTIHIHQVCSHWRASTSPLAAPRPWVVAGHPRLGRERWHKVYPVGRYSLWLPRGRVPVHVPRAPPGLSHCLGTPRGWLALAAADADAPTSPPPAPLLLWEPVSRSEIHIPYLRGVLQVFLSADPLICSPAAGRGWMALASHRAAGGTATDLCRVSYWRPGDAAWTDLAGRTVYPVNSAAFHQGKFYFTCDNGTFFGYDLNPGGGGGAAASGPAPAPERFLFYKTTGMFDSSVCDCCEVHPVRAVHVAACAGDLLLVAVGRSFGRHRRGGVVRVYRPAVRAVERGMTVMEPGERVSDLGEHALFLGRGESFALSANEFPGIERNHVYYVDHDQSQSEQRQWISVFDLSSNVCERVPYPVEHRNDGSNWWPYTWFCPRRPFLVQ